jgi:hypothetical protein
MSWDSFEEFKFWLKTEQESKLFELFLKEKKKNQLEGKGWTEKHYYVCGRQG